MPLVMLVEDEPVLRSSMARGLARLPDVEVIDAGLLRDAIRLLEAERPDLIVSDLDLPDGSGVEILNVLDGIGLRVPVIFVTAYLGSFRGQLPTRSDVEVYEKPLSLRRLREVVLRHLEARGGPSVLDSPFSLADYLQLACMGRHSVILEVSRGGERVGAIVVYRGQVWSAEAHGEHGELAVANMAFGPGGTTSVRRVGEDPGPRNVQRAWQHILLDAARIHDEAARDRKQTESGQSAPPETRAPTPAPEPRPKAGPRPPSAPLRQPRESAGPADTLDEADTTPLPGVAPRRTGDLAPMPPPLDAPAARRPSRTGGGAAPAEAAQARAASPAAEPRPKPKPVVAAAVPVVPVEPAVAVATPAPAAPAPAAPAVAVEAPAAAVETPAPAPPAAPDTPPEPFEALLDRGLDAMLTREYEVAWIALTAANSVRPDVPTILANLARLRQMGYGESR